MPQALNYQTITCPYCYSNFDVEIDISAGEQDFYEDCETCCAPVELILHMDSQGDLSHVDVKRGNG